jgi:Phospholipase_D-nuclease N-terminal
MQLLLLAQNTGVPEVVGGLFSMFLVLWILAIVATVFWVWMLIDALVNERTTEEKLLWFLVVFLLHFIGAIIYYVVRKSGRGSSLVR